MKLIQSTILTSYLLFGSSNSIRLSQGFVIRRRTPVLIGSANDQFSRHALSSNIINEIQQNIHPLSISCAHRMTVEECLEDLKVNKEYGLSQDEGVKRLSIYGENKLFEPRKKSVLELVVEQCGDKMVQLLLAIATLSSFLAFAENDHSAFVEPIAIFSIVMLYSITGVYQSRSADESLQSLKKLQSPTATVFRSGQWISDFPAEKLVPGDIIYIRVGDRVPADSRILFLKTATLGVDESCLTGESLPVQKSADPILFNESEGDVAANRHNMLFSGTVITNGIAQAVVTKTGMLTELGKIEAGIQIAKQNENKTPLTEKMDEFSDKISKIIGVICIFAWVVNIPRFSNPVFGTPINGALHFAKLAVAMGVAALPEGLPAIITLCLSLGTRRMANKNAIIRKLPAVETLGCTSVICTDKTGTLTTNQMTVTSLATVKSTGCLSSTDRDDIETINTVSEYSVSGLSYDPRGSVQGWKSDESPSLTFDIASTAAICNEAKVMYNDGQYTKTGDSTEVALRVFLEKLSNSDLTRSDSHFPQNNNLERLYSKLATLEFNRDRKSMSVLSRYMGVKNPYNRLFVKGAAEMLVQRCNRVKLENGEVIPMTPELRGQITSMIENMAIRPLRCIALAMKERDELGELNTYTTPEEAKTSHILSNEKNYERIESDLVFLGLCGIKDPARPEAADAILRCKEAGIRIMMITGDSKETAVAIAKEVNILNVQDDLQESAFTGKEFFSLPRETQMELLKQGNKVFCRTEPQDKQKLISMLKELGEVPAMTGDGVNDAPALQQASIGIAMGITGTEVAKNAADMILADDNFATIVRAIEEGRVIYNNMRSFISFLVSTNIGEVVIMLTASILGLPEPFTPLHLLWMNFVTDGPPATSLSFNPPEPDVMKRPPRSKKEPIFSNQMIHRFVASSAYVAIATLGAFVWWYMDKGVTLKQLMTWSQCLDWDKFAHTAVDSESMHLLTDPCDIFTTMKRYPQTLALTVLVLLESFKALNSISLQHSLIKMPPWRNPKLIIGSILPLILHLFLLYVPALAKIFGVSPLSLREWKMALLFAFPIIPLEEALKFWQNNRHNVPGF